MTDDEIRVLELQAMLRRLVAIQPAWLPSNEFTLALSKEEQRQYRAALAYSLKTKREHAPTLSADARAYWDAFRDLCKRVNITRGRERRNALVDEAAELMERFRELSGGDQRWFRPLDLRKGDTKWVAALHELEHDLPFLDESHERPEHYDHVENYTQQECLKGIIDRLQPKQPAGAATPASSALLNHAKRLRR